MQTVSRNLTTAENFTIRFLILLKSISRVKKNKANEIFDSRNCTILPNKNPFDEKARDLKREKSIYGSVFLTRYVFHT